MAKRMVGSEQKICPVCQHAFRGNGWDGIDAHWRSKHEDVMPYEDQLPLFLCRGLTMPMATAWPQVKHYE